MAMRGRAWEPAPTGEIGGQPPGVKKKGETLKRTFLLIFIVLFFAVCALPGAVMLSGVKAANLEKRQLAEMPAAVLDGKLNLGFPKEFDSFMSDNFGFRQYYVTGWAALDYYLLGCSSNSSVIAGREGWLFFGDESRDYLGRNLLSATDIARIVKTLRLEREYLASKGVAFVFTVAPNKSTVYGEYMPARYVKASGESNLGNLSAALAGSGVGYCDLYAALMAQKSAAQLYHMKDSHWNNIGALAGYRALMGSLSDAMGGFQYDNYENASYTWKKDWSGDLETMLLPALGNLDWQAEYDIPQAFRYSGRPKTMEDMRIVATSGVNEDRLLMFRDSFANALIPILSNAFGYTYYTRSVPYDLTLAGTEKAGAVVEEIVERNIPSLLAAAPVMPAPLRDVPGADATTGSASASAAADGSGKLLKISGWAQPGQTGEGLPETYVELAGKPGTYAFEPFPIGEGEPPQGMASPSGFTMYLDADTLPKGNYNVNVLIKTDGGFERAATGLTITIH
jgi:hypothetical protein